MKLIWSLANRTPELPHSQYIYDMFYLSIHMAKELGYETILYGSTDAIDRLGEFVDETYNIDNLEYRLFDDVKVYIWKTRNDEYTTIDGDVFLHSKIHFNQTPSTFVSFDEIINLPNNGYINNSYNIINNLGITQLIPEWNNTETKSFSTNLIHWKQNNGLLQYFINSYETLRNWYLKNENLITELDSELAVNNSLISHFMCEHLLQRIISYYGLSYDEMRTNNKNSYYHWQGSDKFTNMDKVECIRLITERHKQIGGNIKDIYNSLVELRLIQPILYP
jgi:hypothetical protein